MTQRYKLKTLNPINQMHKLNIKYLIKYMCHMWDCHRFWSGSLGYSAQQNLQSKTEFAEINKNTLEI